MNKQLETRLKKSDVKLLLDFVFFASLVARIPHEEVPGIGTACTDGTKVKWDPKFAESISDEELLFVDGHEYLHNAFVHFARRPADCPMSEWNIYADYEINCVLKDFGLGKMPKGGLLPPKEFWGKNAEWYWYNRDKLPKPPPPPSQGQPGKGQPTQQPASDPGGCGGVEEPKQMTQVEKQQKAEEWKVALTQAATIAKSQGKMPAGLDRLIQSIVNPKVPWTVRLRDYLEMTAKNDYNWSRPNARHLQRGFVLPSLISESLPGIVFAGDTSGSMGQKELDQNLAEASDILGHYDTTINLIWVDAKVAHVEELTRVDLPLKLNAKGGGGTDFRPAFEWADKLDVKPCVFIYLTDGCGTFPKEAPEYPVLWIMTTDVKPPFGDVIRIEV